MKLSEEVVTMDFNHPLAGNHLFFKGEITDIREATDEEKAHGHIHQSEGCGSCSECGGEGGHC
jgi:FKBP-type peptidyl-prolyl cis-trans isomerase SlyD